MAASPAVGPGPDAIFILGDWFEVWLGDDDDDPFVLLCASVMRQRAKTTALYLMHGNRDFLMGLDFASRCDATLLPDPTILEFNASSYLLSHGDALCTDDEAYIRFREIVRGEEWQADFLAKPLPERRDIARKIRAQSSQINQQKATYADVNESKALEWLNTHGCDDLIHGHTHQPASHRLGNGQRHVLSDWDAEATPARAQILRLTHQGFSRLPL